MNLGPLKFNKIKKAMNAISKNGGLTTDRLHKQVKSRSKRIYLASMIGESTNLKRRLSTVKPNKISLIKYAASMINKAFGKTSCVCEYA